MSYFLFSCNRWLVSLYVTQDHVTVVCLVAWPSNKSEAFIDLVSIETSLFFLRKFLLISMRTSLLT